MTSVTSLIAQTVNGMRQVISHFMTSVLKSREHELESREHELESREGKAVTVISRLSFCWGTELDHND